MYIHFLLVSMGTNLFITIDIRDLTGLFLLQIKTDEEFVTFFFLNGLQ